MTKRSNDRVPLLWVFVGTKAVQLPFLQPFSTCQEGLQPAQIPQNITNCYEVIIETAISSCQETALLSVSMVTRSSRQENQHISDWLESGCLVWVCQSHIFRHTLYLWETLRWGFYLLQAFPQVFPLQSRQDDFALVLLEGADGENIFLTEDFPKDSHFEASTL